MSKTCFKLPIRFASQCLILFKISNNQHLTIWHPIQKYFFIFYSLSIIKLSENISDLHDYMDILYNALRKNRNNLRGGRFCGYFSQCMSFICFLLNKGSKQSSTNRRGISQSIFFQSVSPLKNTFCECIIRWIEARGFGIRSRSCCNQTALYFVLFPLVLWKC